MGGPIEVSPVLRLHALTRGLSRFAAPFFSAQAEPFSRRRIMLGRLAVSVWRFGEFFGVLVFLPVHGVILSFWGSVHLLAPHRMMGAASI